MPITITPYNHTAKLISEGVIEPADTFKVALYTAATFNAANTTLAGVTKTEVDNGNGYTTGGQALANVAVTTVSTSGSKFDADDLTWTASGADLTASFAILYGDTETGDPPLFFIDFGGSKTAGDGTDFKLIWNASGIWTGAWTA